MKKNKKWFSLIELIVVISMISIIWIAAWKINFNKLIDNQNSLMFSNDIYSNIEKVRNNSLLWKWVSSWTLIQYPEKWLVKIWTWWTNWTISWFFSTWWILTNYNEFKVNFINANAKINKLTCYNITKNNPNTKSNIDIEMIWNTITLSWCTTPDNKILDIETNYKWFKKVIRINTINWVIEKIDN